VFTYTGSFFIGIFNAGKTKFTKYSVKTDSTDNNNGLMMFPSTFTATI
jgi:hypothetical protein